MMVETAKILINPPTVIIKVPPPHSEHGTESCCGPCQRGKPSVGTGTSSSLWGEQAGTSPRRISANSRTRCSTERDLCSLQKSLPFASLAGQALLPPQPLWPCLGKEENAFPAPFLPNTHPTLFPSPLPPGAETCPFPWPSSSAHQPLPQGHVLSVGRTWSLSVIEPYGLTAQLVWPLERCLESGRSTAPVASCCTIHPGLDVPGPDLLQVVKPWVWL